MKVLFLSYEVAPIYKFGGLGDIAYALPKALKKRGVDIRVGMPVYRDMSTPRFLPDTQIPMYYSESKLYTLPGVVGVPSVKKHKALAFAYFCQDILRVVRKENFMPDIIHLNDWHTGLISLLIKQPEFRYFANAKTLLTIHNTRHQGKFSLELMRSTPQVASIVTLLEKNNRVSVNFLRRAIINADWVTTVSEYFATEIQQHKFGFGVGLQLIRKGKKFGGILNGIDYDLWNTATDRSIKFNYTPATTTEGKAQNKAYIQKKLGLPVRDDVPLFGMVARISWQKGFGILIPLLKKILPKLDIQIIVLGEENEKIAADLVKVAKAHPDKLVFINAYNEPLAHQFFASSDFFLIPSVFEPCGLTQMIAMRYGAIPLTSAVGGLKDTVKDAVTGYVFYGYNQRGLRTVLKHALLLWDQKDDLERMRQAGMKEHFSNMMSAEKYLQLYQKMLK